MNENAKERLASLKGNTDANKVRKSNVSYKSASSIPKEPQVTGLKLYVGKWRLGCWSNEGIDKINQVAMFV